MKKTTLIAGKDYPAGTTYSNFAANAERNVLITLPAGVEIEATGHNGTITWNRPSPISARSLILKALNDYKSLDEVILVFDAQFNAPDYALCDIESFSKVCDELILGYSYITQEVLKQFEKQNRGRLVFVLKYMPTFANPVKTGPEIRPASIPLAVAQEAFIAMAENFAARAENQNKQYQITLVRADSNSDSEICTWLFSYLDELQNRKTTGWLKPGSKTGKVFSFLK